MNNQEMTRRIECLISDALSEQETTARLIEDLRAIVGRIQGAPAEAVQSEPNCPLKTGLRPCECDLPRCPVCNYTAHDAAFEMDHASCAGKIPGQMDQQSINGADGGVA